MVSIVGKRLIEADSLRDKVYEVLKNIIIFQEIPPGEKIDEDHLAMQLGVSRTPIRESLYRLEKDGVVRIIPRRGAFTVKHSRKEIIEILFVREVLEGLAARLAAERIDDLILEQMKSLFRDFSRNNLRDRDKHYIHADLEFHDLIIKTCDNSLLVNMANMLNNHIKMLRLRTVSLNERIERSLQEHLRIIDAFERRNPVSAESFMREHIQNVKDSVLKNIEAD
jgi:DNA-binding GntR family transcriptional regulator